MPLTINLISEQQKQVSRSRRLVWAGIVAGGVGLIIAVATVVTVWSYQLVVKRQVDRSQKQIQGLQQRLVELTQIEQRQTLLNNRLLTAHRLLSDRPDTSDRLAKLVASFPSSVVIETVKIVAGEPAAVLTVSSSSYTGFAESLKILSGGSFTVVEVTGVNRDKNGDFKLGLEIEL